MRFLLVSEIMKKMRFMFIFLIITLPTYSQLEYVETIYDGHNGALLEDVTGITQSHNGKFLFLTSQVDDAITILKTTGDPVGLTLVSSFRNGERNVDHLNHPYKSAISRDDRFFYVTTLVNRAICAFKVDTVSGDLSYLGKYSDSRRMNHTTEILISQDNRFLYVTTNDVATSNILVFSRDEETGELSFVQESKNQIGQALINEIIQTDDGRFIYTSSSYDDAIGIFKVDSASGALESLGGIASGYSGIELMRSPGNLNLSPDNKLLFAVSNSDANILTFTRDAESGLLEFTNNTRIGQFDIPDLGNIRAMFFSPSGVSLFCISGLNSGTLSVFSCSNETGELEYENGIHYAYNNNQNLYGLHDGLFSKDNKHIFCLANYVDALSVWSWDESTRSLDLQLTMMDGEGGDIQGLGGANDIILTKDGATLYCSGTTDGSITTLNRNVETGKLTFVEEINYKKDSIFELTRVNHLVLTPNEKFLYASGYNAILIFTRDTISGEIKFHQTVKNKDDVVGLNGVKYLAISHDGNYLLSSSSHESALCVFAIDLLTGNLAQIDTHKDGVSGTDGLGAAYEVVISSDDRFVYIGSQTDDAVSTYELNPNTGSLTKIQQISNGEDGILDMDGVMSLLLSSDDRFLYVLSLKCNSIFCFEVDSVSGLLSFSARYENSLDSYCKDLPRYQAISPDGLRYYLPSRIRGLLFTYARDPQTGSLTHLQTLQDQVDGVLGLSLPHAVIPSQDNKHVYVAASGEDGIILFNNLGENTGNPTISLTPDQRLVFPNPTSGTINIVLSEGDRYEIFDLHGNLIMRSSKKIINMVHFSNGTYIIRIYRKQRIPIVEKIILKR